MIKLKNTRKIIDVMAREPNVSMSVKEITLRVQRGFPKLKSATIKRELYNMGVDYKDNYPEIKQTGEASFQFVSSGYARLDC
jgi:hypothetical protein